MKFRYRNITLLLFFFLILGVPYALRLADRRLEIYHSVILPFGTNKVQLKDSTLFPVKEIYGLTPEGALKKLDKSTFLQNIRVGYFDLLYDAHFGLQELPNRDFTTTRFNIPVKVVSKVSAEDIAATKTWIRERLKEQGCTDSLLLLKRRHIYVLKDGRYVADKILVNDTILELH